MPSPAPSATPATLSRPWKTVRVFLSSTFRDMQAERDYLVRFVFPRLREQLLSRRIHLVDVDLRWGVTGEQDATEVCRDVIDECRPRFLCLLGGRYGWLPPDRSRSITADEIHYGVLDLPIKERGFAYFFFREESATASMEERVSGEFREPPGSDKERKLAALKEEIISAGFNPLSYPARWDAERRRLTGLEEFGGRVSSVLEESLEADPELQDRMPTDAVRRPEEFDDNNQAMEAFAEERRERFVLGSRETALQQLLTHARSTGGSGYACLTGPPGSGKSALLAYLCRHETLSSPPSPLLIYHFVGASSGSTDVRRTLRRLCHELKTGSSEFAAEIPDDPARLRLAFADFLRRVSCARRVVIVIDAINELDASSEGGGFDWLPEVLPADARIIVSSLAGPTLDELRRRLGRPLEIVLEPLSPADGAAIIDQFSRRYRKDFEKDQRAALLAKTDAGTPLYLLTALEELRTLGTFEEINARIAELPPVTHDLFTWMLDRLENDDGFRDGSGRPVGRELVSRFCALLGSSRHGLSQRELEDLLDPDDPQGNVAALLYLLRPYLMRRGELIDYFHGQFRAAAARSRLKTDAERRAAHQNLAAYFEGKEFGPRYVEELPWQLKAAGEKDRLLGCLTRADVFLALFTRELQYDLLGYWRGLEKDADPATAYREALARAPENGLASSGLCIFAHQVARFLAWIGRAPAAEVQYRFALSMAERIYGSESLAAAAVRSNLAELLTASGRHAEAGGLYEAALKSVAAHPEDAKLQGIALSNLGNWRHANGDYAGAEDLIRQALAIHESSQGPDSEEAAVDRLNLAAALTELHRFEEAESHGRRALDFFQGRYGTDHPETARCQARLALILHYLGRLREAEALYLQALAAYEKAGPLHARDVTALRHNLSRLLMDNSRSIRRS